MVSGAPSGARRHRNDGVAVAAIATIQYHALRPCFVTVVERDPMLRLYTDRTPNQRHPNERHLGGLHDGAPECTQQRKHAQHVTSRRNTVLAGAWKSRD